MGGKRLVFYRYEIDRTARGKEGQRSPDYYGAERNVADWPGIT